jgi:hypothetical protein
MKIILVIVGMALLYGILGQCTANALGVKVMSPNFAAGVIFYLYQVLFGFVCGVVVTIVVYDTSK